MWGQTEGAAFFCPCASFRKAGWPTIPQPRLAQVDHMPNHRSTGAIPRHFGRA